MQDRREPGKVPKTNKGNDLPQHDCKTLVNYKKDKIINYFISNWWIKVICIE